MESEPPGDMGSLERLRELFQKILQSKLSSLDQEIESLLHYTLRHDALEQTDPREKVQEVLNILLDRGEEACQGFLDNLSRNQHLFPQILRILKETRADNIMFMPLIEDLGLGTFLQRKLTLPLVQSLCCDELSDASYNSMKDIPMHCLRHLMAMNIQEAFRSFDSNCEDVQNNPEQDTVPRSVHPLDVLCGLLHCSDNFLRQEIIKRMSECQVPVPLLLPAGEEGHGTFLLWAMRGITRSRSPSLLDDGILLEDSVVNISLPVFSFVRMGECKSMSIDKIINQILAVAQQRNQDDLVHRGTSWGNIPRYISDGLVEISWYFPGDQMDLKPLEKPFAMTYLHGDLQSNMKQFQFLTQVSSAVFILMENMSDQQWDQLSHARGNTTKYYFIVQDQFNQESGHFGLNEQNVLMESDKNFMEKLQFILKDEIQESSKQMMLSEMSVVASELDFCSDENQPGCEYGRLHALDLIDDLVNVIKYKGGYVKQQEHPKIRIAKIEKELCRLMDQRELPTPFYKSILTNEMCHHLLMARNYHIYSDIITNLQYAFTYLHKVEQLYFLKWIQFQKFPTNDLSAETRQEDVLCKVGQMYETEVLAGRITETPRLCGNFPKAAADLLLQGIPLELIDGDTTNIHLSWITDVLTELHTKTNGKCRIKVISVLGVQGTGKSTLLNTMFGLQFPVASRQCTRGALMSLIEVKEKDLGCDFLVVIDCEGLRALDKAPVEESFDHDNELATLVVGLSDIAIIHMALGGTSEMQNILQIVVHALLRMKGTGQTPNCLSVYQKVDGASSEEETVIEDRGMLRAHIDKSSKFLRYNDPIECNILEDHLIIPPFKPETSCYSEKVIELKRQLLQMIKLQSQSGRFRNLQNFADNICALWNSVKHENYIFRFKNILEENVYTELYKRFLKLEFNLCRKMHEWWTNGEVLIYTHQGELNTEALVQEALILLNKEVRAMEESLQVYFPDNSEDSNSHVAKKFEVEFMEKIQSLKSLLETQYTNKCLQITVLRRGLANTIVKDFIGDEWDPDETNCDIERFYNDAVTKYQPIILKKHDVQDEFLQLLRRDMRTKGSAVTELIHGITNLSDFAHTSFTYDGNHGTQPQWKCPHMENCVVCANKREGIAKFLLQKSHKYVEKMMESKTAYDPVYGMEILNMVNEVIYEDTVLYTVLFELDLKLKILAQCAPCFQKKHDDFLKESEAMFAIDHQGVMNHLRIVLQNIRTAKNYCQDCLKPAVELEVKKMFQQKLVSDYTNYLWAMIKSSPRSSEGSHGLTCTHHAAVEDPLGNICNHYTDQNEMIQIILTNFIPSVIAQIRAILNHPDILEYNDTGYLLTAVWSVLDKGRSGVSGQISNAPFNVAVSDAFQCASYLDFFVKKLEKQIQEEFSSRSIEEHYKECLHLINEGVLGSQEKNIVTQGSSCGQGH